MDTTISQESGRPRVILYTLLHGEYLVHTVSCVVLQLLNHPKSKSTKTAVTKCAKHSLQRHVHAHRHLVHRNGFSLSFLCYIKMNKPITSLI